MEFERPVFPLLNETLNYLDIGVTGKVVNIVRSKNNKFVFHMLLQKGIKINNDELDLALLNEDVIPLSRVQPGLLLGCLHPQNKKWMRCYVVSILHREACVALCDTGEMTKTKKLKDIPDRYKSIPVITFEAEIKCICPYGKLRHLMENFKDYIATFEPFKNKQNSETLKKMYLIYNNSSIEFIIKKWDPQNCFLNTDYSNFNSVMFKNGSAVIIAKVEIYDWRHIFVRSIDHFVDVGKKLQTYCENVSNIQRDPIVGEIVAVKCVDKFYRGKIIDIIDKSSFSLYLIDMGYVISATIECIVDLSEVLKKIPSTVCLVGLKDITLKPWTPETYLYITSLFENSTTMILEYIDHDPFGLDSVTLTIINNNEDVNEHLKELLIKSVDDLNYNLDASLNPVNDLNISMKLQSNTFIPVKVSNIVKSDSQIMPEYIDGTLQPGSTVYMTGFVDLEEIYIRKVEDHNNEFDKLLDLVNEFCLSAMPISRPLVIGEIVGAKSTLDNSFYRGKVLRQIDNSTYLIQYIDFGDKDNVTISNIFEIPHNFMTPSNVIKITLNGVKSRPLNSDTLNYITNLLSNYEPMIIEFSPIKPFKNVNLTTVNGNENVNERLNELLNNDGISTQIEIVKQHVPENINNHEKIQSHKNVPKLRNGDLVFITTFIDVHHIFVRKTEDENDQFFNFIENVNSYCSAETPIGKLPKLNDIIGAKSIADGSFYRAKVIKKINDVSYNVQFIDYGIEENVNLSDIVALSNELKEFISTTIMVKLKNVPFSILNEAAREYVTFISENETLIVNISDDDINEVILKTDKNVNINDHLNMLIFGSKIELNSVGSKEIKKQFEHECRVKFVSKIVCPLDPGSIVYMTSFVDLNEIYIRKLEDYNDEYHNFLDKVNEFCLSAAPISKPLIIGEIIGAKCTLDNSFYRGKVLNQIDNTTYLIQYIDFGDKDSVSVSNIFEIPKDFMIPSTIMKINLKGVKSCKLNAEASNFITNLLSTYEPMKIDFDPQFPLKDVTLIIINSNENVTESLNKLLKDEDYIAVNSVEKDKCVTELNDDINEYKSFGENNMLKDGDIVYVTAYVDIHNIFIRKVDNNDEFQKLNERVNTYCSLENTSESNPLELNQIVGAKSSVDGYFYRAKVIEKTEEKLYNVMFIDFGFEESVIVTEIVPLPIQLQQVAPSITVVGLKDSNFENLSVDGYNYLDNLILHSELMKIEFNELNSVTLTVISQGKNVIDCLNELCVDDTIMDNTIIDNVDSGMKYISHNISIPQIPPLTNKSIVTVHAFISPKDIYISVPFNESEMNKFIKDFSMFCLSSQPITRNLGIGEVFGIRSSIDGSFYRGAIKEKLNENQYRVVLYDLGTEDTVSANSFVEISEQLKQVPRCIYSVSLKGIDSINLNAQAMSYVNMLCHMPLIIEFDERNPNGLNAVTFTTVKTQQNVNHHLTTLLSEKERDSPETVQLLSKGDIVYISSFVDLQTIYVKKINNGTDKFKSFLENFSSCCALENPIEKEPVIGEIVAAREKNGNKFYRAEIISKLDKEHFNICFIDFGSRDTVHISNIVQPSELQLQNCPPTFMVSLKGLQLEPVKPAVMQYIKKISQTETFIIDTITDQHKVILISVNTQCNINKEIKKLIEYSSKEIKIQNEIHLNGDINIYPEKSVINYNKPPLEVPTQVWIAEKISYSKYSVYTYESRLEFMRLENLIFEDSKTFESVKSVRINMPCIVYFSPSWYRGEVLDVIDKVTVKVNLIDVGNFSIVRNIKEIFHMPSKYKGKSLLVSIIVQPESQEKVSTTTFKIIAKKYLDDGTVLVDVVGSFVDQSYGDLDNVGLPSFSSTPIPDDSGQFLFVNSRNERSLCTTLCQDSQTTSSPTYSPGNRFSNMLTIKDVQYAKWPKGSSKTLTFLCTYQGCLVMRDHLIDDALTDLEIKIQDYCATVNEPYRPVENEICLAKYCDQLWYRAICIKTADVSESTENNFTVYFLDWGIEYSVNGRDIYKMSKEFVYLPATAHKCYIIGITASELNNETMNALSQYMLTQVNCQIVDRQSNDSYMITCETLKNLIDVNLQLVL